MFRKSGMAEVFATGCDRQDIWKEIDKVEGRSRQIPPQIDNVTDPAGINNLISNKYKELLNSVPSHSSVISRIDEKITEYLRSYNSDDHIITVQLIKYARERLKNDKHDGGAGL